MASITLSVPEEVRKVMKKFPEVNWCALVRKAIIEEIGRRELKGELFSSPEGERDFVNWSVEIGRRAKKGRLKRVSGGVSS